MGNGYTIPVFVVYNDEDYVVIEKVEFSKRNTPRKLFNAAIKAIEKKHKSTRLFNAAIKAIEKKHKSTRFVVSSIKTPFFFAPNENSKVKLPWQQFLKHITWLDEPLNDFKLKHLVEMGLHFDGDFLYEHKPNIDNKITCKHMLNHDELNINNCPFYQQMKYHHITSGDHLKHFVNYRHYTVINSKSECRYNYQCHAYQRLLNRGNQIKDLCHMQMYRHPPRGNRMGQLIELNNDDLKEDCNINTFIFVSSLDCSKSLHPDIRSNNFSDCGLCLSDENMYTAQEPAILLKCLIDEVIKNGFIEDLYVENDVFYDSDDYEQDDSKDLNVYVNDDKYAYDKYTIMNIVRKKMRHKRINVMDVTFCEAEMLALLLYTGCYCTYSLCHAQRNGDYETWKWFDYCLYSAIMTLSVSETGDYTLYSGLSNVKLNKKTIENGYFVTYVSSSWDKDVALAFIKEDQGCLFEMDGIRGNFEFLCCDVSWISKHTYESEVLIARTNPNKFGNKFGSNGFTCRVMDEINGIQMISLKSN